MSTLDEHTHYDYALELDAGRVPHRGSLYSDALLKEWSCGVGHQAGPLRYPCGDPRLSVRDFPQGEYTTGYIHYPTYFAAANMFRGIVEGTTGNHSVISEYRLFSALLLLCGVAVSGMFGYALRLRGARLVAATFLPAACSMIFILGTMVNPGSTAILCGALIGGTGLLWVIRGRGFGWLAAAAAFGSVIAVTDSFSTGAFALLTLVAILAGRFGWQPSGPWKPRLYHLITLTLIVLTPIILWGRYIAATATVPNSALFSFETPATARTVLTGMVTELFGLHIPWESVSDLGQHPTGLLLTLLRAPAGGLAQWINIIVFGAIILAVLRIVFQWSSIRAAERPVQRRTTSRVLNPIPLLAICTLAVIILYPPALRYSNWLTFGFDFPIVARYSITFTPLLTYLALLLAPQRRFGAVLAGFGIAGVVALSVGVL